LSGLLISGKDQVLIEGNLRAIWIDKNRYIEAIRVISYRFLSIKSVVERLFDLQKGSWAGLGGHLAFKTLSGANRTSKAGSLDPHTPSKIDQKSIKNCSKNVMNF